MLCPSMKKPESPKFIKTINLEDSGSLNYKLSHQELITRIYQLCICLMNILQVSHMPYLLEVNEARYI
ncbi:hypothetical protein NTG1052_40024 [Candidatus Nitrotoga sp. 1052]|nr:hypothetical protein NTG1052_40024 [Candidatus Nitrotoga sp. 1052]